jgi:hypothetical protein
MQNHGSSLTCSKEEVLLMGLRLAASWYPPACPLELRKMLVLLYRLLPNSGAPILLFYRSKNPRDLNLELLLSESRLWEWRSLLSY